MLHFLIFLISSFVFYAVNKRTEGVHYQLLFNLWSIVSGILFGIPNVGNSVLYIFMLVFVTAMGIFPIGGSKYEYIRNKFWFKSVYMILWCTIVTMSFIETIILHKATGFWYVLWLVAWIAALCVIVYKIIKNKDIFSLN